MPRLIGCFILAASLLIAAPGSAQEQKDPAKTLPLHRVDAQSAGGLQEVVQIANGPLPLVSGHRGGPGPGYPENCLATFEHTLQRTFALLEIDPRYTKDKQLVLLHDPTLDRTTTGKGNLADFTLAELSQLRLKDTAGKPTEFHIPTLGEALDWARGKTVLVLDQKDVPVAARIKAIEEHQAEASAMLIVYSFEGAKEAFALNPRIMLEVMIPSLAKVKEFDATGVPWRNVIAFVGHQPPAAPELYAAIHERGARCMVGSSRNLDRQVLGRQAADIKQLEAGYRDFLKLGADLIETDIPVQLGPLLYGAAPQVGKLKAFQIK